MASGHELAELECELGPRIPVIKLGSLGALALADGTVHTHPIVPIEPVGAGDAFVGAFLAELANSEPIESASPAGRRWAPSAVRYQVTGRARSTGATIPASTPNPTSVDDDSRSAPDRRAEPTVVPHIDARR